MPFTPKWVEILHPDKLRKYPKRCSSDYGEINQPETENLVNLEKKTLAYINLNLPITHISSHTKASYRVIRSCSRTLRLFSAENFSAERLPLQLRRRSGTEPEAASEHHEQLSKRIQDFRIWMCLTNWGLSQSSSEYAHSGRLLQVSNY